MVLSAVEEVVSDEMFTIPSHNASAVIMVGTKMTQLLKKYPSHCEEVDRFCSSLVTALHGCIPPVIKAATREALWRNYHELRCSKDYLSVWQVLGEDYLPLFSQSVGHRLLEQLIKQASLVAEEDTCNQQQPITEIEMMALRYAAGYVPRSLLKKLPKSTNPIKQGLQLCLWDILDDEHEGGTADSWIQAVDRGGLMSMK